MFRQDATGHPGTTCRTRRQVPVVDGQATVFLSFHRAGEASGFTAFAEAVAAMSRVADTTMPDPGAGGAWADLSRRQAQVYQANRGLY